MQWVITQLAHAMSGRLHPNPLTSTTPYIKNRLERSYQWMLTWDDPYAISARDGSAAKAMLAEANCSIGTK